MNKKIGFTLLSITVVAVLFFLTTVYSHQSRTKTPSTLMPALTVTTHIPHKESWPVTLTAHGSIEPWEEAIISARLSGYPLTEILVNVGDQVKKGQLLARVDSGLLLIEHDEFMANATLANANRQRALTLQGKSAISEQEALHTITQSKIANAALAGNALKLRYTDILAPDDGVISARSATLGATVAVGQELFRLIRQQKLEWRGDVTALQLEQIKPGQSVTLHLPDGRTAIAITRQNAPTFNNQTRLGMVYADVKPDEQTHAGMYVAGDIELGNRPALVIPANSLTLRDGRNYVFTVAPNTTLSSVSQHVVTVGRRMGPDVEITQGLTDEDVVVVKGGGFLSEGDIVRIVGQPLDSGVGAR